jgi:hypothetical protein
MNSFNNIFDSSKINKKNKKIILMKKYIELQEKTKSLEQEKLQILKENMNDIERKVEFQKEIQIEESLLVPDFSKDIFFQNNNLNIDSLISNFEKLNETSSQNINLIYQDINSIPFEDKLNLLKLNSIKIGNKNRFNFEFDNELNNNSKLFNPYDQSSISIKTVGNTLEDKELIKELNSEINKELCIENKDKMESNILTNVQIINMIYKESYKNKYVTGFGDFLRGSYFILDFCRKFKIKYNILIYHPIHHFFKHPTINREIPNTIIDSIEYCEYCNINFDANSTFNSDISTLYKEFFNYLNRQDIYNRNLFIYTVCYPTLQIHSENKQIIRKIIEPIDEIENNINQILGQLKLFKKNYIIIQIRSGDDFLNKSNNKLSNEYKEKIISILKNLILGKKKAFLLIADNLLVKNLIIRQFPFIKTFFKDITHLGENAKLNRENIKNTLIDFYIMSYASFIYSISTYEHGSGFSKWCAVTYEIPYHCIKI